jgi:hypothetical protein
MTARWSTSPTPIAPISSAVEPRPRSASELIDVSIQLLRRNAPGFFTVAAIAYVPILVVQVTLFRGMMAGFRTGNLAALASVPPGLFGVFGLVSVVWYCVCTGALIVASNDAYRGYTIDPWSSFQRAFPSTFDIIIAVMAKYIFMIVGFFCFIVGIFFVVARYFAVPVTVIIEGTGPFASLDRSAVLSRGIKWHILSTLALAGIIYILLYTVASALGGALALLTGGALVWLQIVSAIMTVVLYPLFAIAQTVLYYDAVARQQVPATAAVAPPPAGPVGGAETIPTAH